MTTQTLSPSKNDREIQEPKAPHTCVSADGVRYLWTGTLRNSQGAPIRMSSSSDSTHIPLEDRERLNSIYKEFTRLCKHERSVIAAQRNGMIRKTFEDLVLKGEQASPPKEINPNGINITLQEEEKAWKKACRIVLGSNAKTPARFWKG